MAELSSLEAAVYYDFVHNMRSTSLPAVTLVVDLDRCMLGIYRCGENGARELLVQEEEQGMRVSALDRLPQEGRAAILNEMKQNMQRFYRTGGKKDGPACALPEAEPPLCSQLDQDFSPDSRRLEALLKRGLSRLTGLGISEEDIRILAIGELAAYYPAEFTLRRCLSPTPLLPDSRFAVLADPPGEIARLGQELYRRNAGHDIVLICLQPDGQKDEIILAEKGGGIAQPPAYCAPLFAADGEPLLLRVDGKDRSLKLPFAPAEGDLVELACQMKGDSLSLLLRRTLAPEQIHEISIGNGEDKLL